MKDKFVEIWSGKNKRKLGLPRPYAPFRPSLITPGKLKLSLKFPIPWQSRPRKKSNAIELIYENELLVYKENRCAYCGIIFSKDEITIRWLTLEAPIDNVSRVFSDYHPFHIECMEEARIYCPFMRTTKDHEFEVDTFKTLRNKADELVKPFRDIILPYPYVHFEKEPID
jgi:hypothetical protein